MTRAAAAAAETALGGVAVHVRPHAYATSHELVDVDVEVGGVVVATVVKETVRRLPARPSFVQRRAREPEVYRRLLHPAGIWAPKLLGIVGPYLVLERVHGEPAWQHDTKAIAARLGGVVRALHDALARSSESGFLPAHDRRYYDRWFRRAAAAFPSVRRLREAHEQATALLLRRPLLVVHGELYPSNVLVRGEDVLAVDWESAALGPAAVDVAALTTGWRQDEVALFLAAYGGLDQSALDAARLHLALRWLGWSSGWTPPLDHRRDWHLEAHVAASSIARRIAA